MTSNQSGVHPVLLVDCPLCDAPMPFDAECGVLACDACGVALEIAEPQAPELAAAA